MNWGTDKVEEIEGKEGFSRLEGRCLIEAKPFLVNEVWTEDKYDDDEDEDDGHHKSVDPTLKNK